MAFFRVSSGGTSGATAIASGSGTASFDVSQYVGSSTTADNFIIQPKSSGWLRGNEVQEYGNATAVAFGSFTLTKSLIGNTLNVSCLMGIQLNFNERSLTTNKDISYDVYYVG